MWLFNPPTRSEDHEALLPGSPASMASSEEDVSTIRSFSWSRLPPLLWSIVLRLLHFIIPSFLRHSSDPPALSLAEKQLPLQIPKIHPTAYLDGVRGLASVIVFFFHWSHIQYPSVNSGYSGAKHHSLWQLPFIRFIYSGAAMVSIFFVISGFVLTHRFIQKMHAREYETLFKGLTSLTFRRALRLFLPALASCILAYICASLGFVSIPKRVAKRPFHHGLGALLTYIDRESDPWTWDQFMDGFYNPQLWSISLEFRGSMVIFLCVLGLARTRTLVRVLVESSIVLHAFAHKRWDVALFLAGMLMAEIDVMVSRSPRWKQSMQTRTAKALMFVSILIGMWMCGYPRDNGPKSLGYKTLSRVGPHNGYRRRFWLGIGSILLTWPLPFLPSVQAFFNTRIIKYSGKISFALYLIHGLGNRTIGTWILHRTRDLIGTETFARYTISFVVSTGVYVPVVVWWSDMFWRAFDVPSTHLAKWIEGICAERPAS